MCFLDFNIGLQYQNLARCTLLIIIRALSYTCTKLIMNMHNFVCAHTRNEPKSLGANNFTLLSFIQYLHQIGILSHLMSALRVDYSLIVHKMRQQGLRSPNLEVEIINGSVNNGCGIPDHPGRAMIHERMFSFSLQNIL
jgi:hypothetical protein